MEELVERLAAEMSRRWRRGERPLAEEYLARYPQLADCPEAAVELIYEEICLQQRYETGAVGSDVLQRFPQWRTELEVLLDCHRLLEPAKEVPQFPDAGETLGEFRLLAELGRGAQGRVFLATQPALADRAVVVKLVPHGGQEHLSLARLQHSHIVPLYAALDFPEHGLRALCMPYFGGLTLAGLLERWREQPPARRTGLFFVEALGQVQQSSPVAIPVRGVACRFLAGASYVRAVCWIGAHLADALQYAHERGLLHLDLKPANVLLAADGHPMLLDFHLARPPIPSGAAALEWLGCTPAYAAPEHLAALAAVAEGRPVATGVDGRADVFALGALLYEALGGKLPPYRNPGRELRRRNPQVTVGLADLIERCLADDPANRYAEAGTLAADLRRHLADLPLQGVANRSVLERWRKWRKRRPFALALFGLLLTGLTAGGLTAVHVQQRLDKARTAIAEGRERLEKGEYEEARNAFQRGLATAEDLPFGGALTQELQDRLRQADRAKAVQELHLFTDRMRILYDVSALPPAEARAAETHCRALWEKRELLTRRLASERLQQVQADLLDLAILWTNLRVRLAEDANSARREALEVLRQAEALFGPSCVLCLEQQSHASALGWAEEAREAARRSATLAPRTAWEHYALGRAFLREGRFAKAVAHFDTAVEMEPQNLWPYFYQGKCAVQRGRYDDAVIAFTACVALSEGSAWCYYNRGLANAGLDQPDRALRDYNHALQLDPTLAAAALNRAMLHYQLKHYVPALADLQRALDNGADPSIVHYDKALIQLADGDKAAAQSSLEQALRHDPGHNEARVLLENLRN
jgi:serine/threonine protein kinase/Flp pilus assembly protein TadD